MSVVSFQMTTHSTEDITDQFTSLKKCLFHKHKPRVLKIVAGRKKEVHFVAICEQDECSKISTESGQVVVDAWNKWN